MGVSEERGVRSGVLWDFVSTAAVVVSIILVTSFLPNMGGFYRRHGGVRHPGDFVSTEHGGCPSCCSRVDVVVDGKCIIA